MAILNGTELKVYSSGTTNLVAYAQNCSLNVNHTTREITNKESAGWKEVLSGLRDYSIDVDGAYAWTNPGGSPLPNGIDDVLQTNIIAGSPAAVDFIFGDTQATSDVSYSGSGYVTSISMSGGTEDTASYSLSIEGTAALVQLVS